MKPMPRVFAQSTNKEKPSQTKVPPHKERNQFLGTDTPPPVVLTRGKGFGQVGLCSGDMPDPHTVLAQSNQQPCIVFVSDSHHSAIAIGPAHWDLPLNYRLSKSANLINNCPDLVFCEKRLFLIQ